MSSKFVRNSFKFLMLFGMVFTSHSLCASTSTSRLNMSQAKLLKEQARRFRFDKIKFSASKEQKTSYTMVDDFMHAKGVFHQDLSKVSFNQLVDRGVEVPLEAEILLDDKIVELRKLQPLPVAGSLDYQRQYYRGVYGRGFRLKRLEFDFFGHETLNRMIELLYPKEAQQIKRKMDVTFAYHSDYLCEPDFQSGFHCYYRFKVSGVMLDAHHKFPGVPNEFQLIVEATDYYQQAGHKLTGVKTKYYTFEFARINKTLEQQTIPAGRSLKFNFAKESLLVDGDLLRNLETLEVIEFPKEGESFIDRFAYQGQDYSEQMRTQLKLAAKERMILSGLNSTVSEDYENGLVRCEKPVRGGKPDFICREFDQFTVLMEIVPAAGI